MLETTPSTPRAEALETAIERIRSVIGAGMLTTAAFEDALADVPGLDRPGYVSVDVMLARDGDRTRTILGEVHGFFWLPTCLLDVLPDRDRVVATMRDAIEVLAAGTPTAECTFLPTQATDRRVPLATLDLAMVGPDRARGGRRFRRARDARHR